MMQGLKHRRIAFIVGASLAWAAMVPAFSAATPKQRPMPKCFGKTATIFVPGTGYHATAKIPCVAEPNKPMSQCDAGVKRAARGGKLLRDVLAGAVLLDHAPHRAHLAFDARKPRVHRFLRFRVVHHWVHGRSVYTVEYRRIISQSASFHTGIR